MIPRFRSTTQGRNPRKPVRMFRSMLRSLRPWLLCQFYPRFVRDIAERDTFSSDLYSSTLLGSTNYPLDFSAIKSWDVSTHEAKRSRGVPEQKQTTASETTDNLRASSRCYLTKRAVSFESSQNPPDIRFLLRRKWTNLYSTDEFQALLEITYKQGGTIRGQKFQKKCPMGPQWASYPNR